MIIQEFELFDGISGKMEEEIATAMNTESYKAGDVIIKEGDPAENFFILRNGVLDVKVAGAKRSTDVAVPARRLVGPAWLEGKPIRPLYSVWSPAPCSESTKTGWMTF